MSTTKPNGILSFLYLQMFDWIMHNKGLFLTSYTEIGGNHQHAVELQTQHNHFAMNCMVRHCFFFFFWEEHWPENSDPHSEINNAVINHPHIYHSEEEETGFHHLCNHYRNFYLLFFQSYTFFHSLSFYFLHGILASLFLPLLSAAALLFLKLSFLLMNLMWQLSWHLIKVARRRSVTTP